LPDPVSGTATLVDHVRLFPNHPDIRWKAGQHIDCNRVMFASTG